VDGWIKWGPGDGSRDTEMGRLDVSLLGLADGDSFKVKDGTGKYVLLDDDGYIEIVNSSSTGIALATYDSDAGVVEANPMYRRLVNGKEEWGPGGDSALDTNMGRLAADLWGSLSTKIWTPDRKGLAHGRFERKDADTGRLTGLAGTSKLIEVGGTYTSLASDIERALTAGNYLLNADGSISTNNPATDTNYYTYLLGPGHSTNPNELRYSETAPNSNGYLGTTGDAAHCRHVGWLHTDGSTQIADETCHSRFKGKTASVRNALPSGTYSPGNATTWEDTGVEVDFLWPPGWAAIVEFTSTSYHNAVNQNTRVRVHLQQKNEETVGPLTTCAAASVRVVIAGARTWRGGVSPVFETAKLQIWTSQVSPNNTTIFKSNIYSDVVVTLIPEETA